MKYPMLLRDDTFEVELDVKYHAVHRPAMISGPPEDCYPDESELTLNGFTVVDIQNLSGEDLPLPTTAEITAAYEEDEARIIAACWEDFHS